MSVCENLKTFSRSKNCRKCQLGKSGYVTKIVNILELNGEVDRLAGDFWIKRGGGISSQEQRNEDYLRALKIFTKKVCRSVK